MSSTDSWIWKVASPHPPLSPERIESARRVHGDAVDEYLQHLQVGDPLADALVKDFEQLPKGAGFELFVRAIGEGIGSIENPPESLVAFFEQVDAVPDWVDWDRMSIASEKIINAGLLTGMAFALCALPHSYLANANAPLVFTRQLVDSTAHRYANTSRFVIESFMPGGLRRDSDGFRLAMIVRYMHAQVRKQIAESDDWDPTLGVPLNQAHLAMNNIFFSVYVMRGLSGLGVDFSAEERESVMITWRYVAYLFGLDPRLICATEVDANQLLQTAFSVEFDPNDASRLLSDAMMKAGPEYMKLRDERLGQVFITLLYPLSRLLLGDELANRLDYPPEKRRLMCFGFVRMVRLFERYPSLMPRSIRHWLGIEFWLDKSHYGESDALKRSHAVQPK
ncbi:MAG: oxygenase MpaB family protein [Verrucomicrobiota bacterium]